MDIVVDVSLDVSRITRNIESRMKTSDVVAGLIAHH